MIKYQFQTHVRVGCICIQLFHTPLCYATLLPDCYKEIKGLGVCADIGIPSLMDTLLVPICRIVSLKARLR